MKAKSPKYTNNAYNSKAKKHTPPTEKWAEDLTDISPKTYDWPTGT